MSAEHDWPGGDYVGMKCCICGVRFSGPHNAGKCYLHRWTPTPEDRGSVPTFDERRLVAAQARIEELEAEVASLHRRIDFFGCPEKICLIPTCGIEGPCGLHCPGEDGKEDKSAPLLCDYDKTYPELIAITHAAEAEVRELRKDRERLDWLDASDMGKRGAYFVWTDGAVAFGCANGGMPIREAVDAARDAEEKLT